MTKILVIAAKLKIGGAEKVAADIGFHADPQRYEVHYVVFGDEIGAYEPELQAKGCKVFHLPQPSDGYHAYMKNLKVLINTYRYDVFTRTRCSISVGLCWRANSAVYLCGFPMHTRH